MDEEGVKSQRDGGKDDLAHLHGQLAHPVSINYKSTLRAWVGARRCEHLQETARGARNDGGMRRVFRWCDAPSGGHVGGG